MFNKLLRNLPFNPSLITQVSFYAKRLKQDAVVRRSGFGLMALTVLVQTFAVISPPQPTLASSSNDLIQGGIQSAEDGAKRCRDNTNGYRDVLDHYDIDCDSLAAAKPIILDSQDKTKNLHTIGKLAYGKKDETPVDIKGKTVWMRPLKDLDQNHSSKHEAFEGKTRTGHKYYIVKSCGGVTFEGVPPAPPPRCEWNSTLLATDIKCFQPCPLPGKSGIAKTSPDCQAACPIPGKTTYKSNDPRCIENCSVKGKESLPKDSANCFPPCEFNSQIGNDNPSCKPCEASVSSQDSTACLLLSKVVRNDTKNTPDANGSTAQAGDNITYVLSAKNQGKAKVDSFIVQENISDVLDYADITSLPSGANLDKDNILSWPASAVKAGETLSREFTVKVKNPVPATPTSASDPGHFDLKMTNVYGNAATVKLPPSAVKSAEVATKTLPNTGPGASLVMAFGMITIIGYFFARSRLLGQELVIVKQDHTANGGF